MSINGKAERTADYFESIQFGSETDFNDQFRRRLAEPSIYENSKVEK